MRRDAAVDRVRKIAVAGLQRFDDCSGVNTSSGAERILTEDGIVRRNDSVRGLGNFFAIRSQ